MSQMFSMRIKKEDAELFKKYAKMHGKSVSEAMKEALLEKIEDEYDLKAYEEAIKEYRKNPVTYTLAEVMAELEEDERQEQKR